MTLIATDRPCTVEPSSRTAPTAGGVESRIDVRTCTRVSNTGPGAASIAVHPRGDRVAVVVDAEAEHGLERVVLARGRLGGRRHDLGSVRFAPFDAIRAVSIAWRPPCWPSQTVGGEGTLSVAGTLAWELGDQTGPGTTVIAPGGTATVNQFAALREDRSLVNRGTLNLAGTLFVAQGASVLNAAQMTMAGGAKLDSVASGSASTA